MWMPPGISWGSGGFRGAWGYPSISWGSGGLWETGGPQGPGDLGPGDLEVVMTGGCCLKSWGGDAPLQPGRIWAGDSPQEGDYWSSCRGQFRMELGWGVIPSPPPLPRVCGHSPWPATHLPPATCAPALAWIRS